MAAANQLSDTTVVDYLRRHEGATIGDLARHMGVTTTAVRQRLLRLMDQGLVLRELEETAEPAGRGRPTHCYRLSRAGARSGGDNYEELATVLWSEVRAVRDSEVRRGLLQRIVRRLAETYRERIEGNSLRERMTSLVELMGRRGVPFDIDERLPESSNLPGNQPGKQSGQLPVLTALACPYPDLAEQDQTVCAMEKMLFSELLGENLRLSACRLDGDTCCTFEANAADVPLAN